MTSRPPYGVTVPGNRWDLLTDQAAPPTSVSVVVTHFEQPAQLERTLAALAVQTHPADLTEILVVDDGSAVTPVVPPGVRLLRQADEGFRAAAARNLGARHATGRVLVFLDADTTPEPECVAQLIRLPALLPEALVVGRRRHADLAGGGAELPDPAWLREGYVATGDLLRADRTSFRYVISAVAACSAWLHDLVGGFDETFSAYGGEDWDWAHRIWDVGGLLAHEPRAVAWHDGPDQSARGGPGERERLHAETLQVGRRIQVPGVAPGGLILGGRDLLVRAGPELSPEELTIALDDLLAALPQAGVQLTATQAAALPVLLEDPRVDLLDDAPAYQRLLDLHRGVRADPATWRRVAGLVDGPGAPGQVTVAGAAEPDRPLVTVTSLRSLRRAQRWDRTDLFEETSLTEAGLRPLPGEVSLQAHVGGWG